MCDFATNEKLTSQVPALQLLIAMGYEYISPEEASTERQERYSNVLLENILHNQLKEINRIRYKGSEYLFNCVERLRSIAACSIEANRVTSGRNLSKLVAEQKCYFD